MLYNFEHNSKTTDLGVLFLRLSVGGLMLVRHGWPKLQKLLNDDPIKFADPFGTGPEIALFLAVFAELICAFLIMIGGFTRAATIPLIITMIVAAFMIHGDDPFQKKEFAILYLIPFIFLLITGAGRFSLDARLSKNKTS
jgi:putative oxidoreductase